MARPSSDGCPTASGLGPSRESTCVGPHRPVGFASDRPRGPRLPLLLLARAAHDDWICFDTRCEVVCRHESRGSALPRRDRSFLFESTGCGRRCRPRHGVAWGRHVVLVCLARARFGGSAFPFVGRCRSVGSRRRWASDSLDASSGSLVHPGSSKLKWLRAKGPAGGRACFSIGAAVCGGLLPHSGQNTHRLRLSSEAALPKGPRRVALLSDERARRVGSPQGSYLVDPASSHMLVSKIKPCMSKYKLLYGETANGSLNQL